jgi:iduronate 2-sulfatase
MKILFCVILASLHVTQLFGQQPKPNVLFIPVDDLRPMLSCYGDSIAVTPNFDRLAQMGVVFDRAYCQQAVCNPSRASLMTGMRPDRLRVWDLYTDFRTPNPDVITLPSYLSEYGYTTVNIGKTFHNVYADSLSWDEMLYVDGFPFDPDAGYAGKENLEIVERRKQKIITSGKGRKDPLGHWYIKASALDSAEVEDRAYYDGAQTYMALKKLDSLHKKTLPFFFSLGFYKPHLPFNAPKKYWDLYERDKLPVAPFQELPKEAPSYAVHGDTELRYYVGHNDLNLPQETPMAKERQQELIHGYYACISYIDAQLGKVLDKLEELKALDNTIIVMWSDHGYKLGDYNSWCKQTNYEVDTRVPMIIAAPGFSENAHTSSLSELVDLYPTVCELVGIPIPSFVDGQSLVPTLKKPHKTFQKAAASQFLMGRFPRKNTESEERMGYSIRTERFRYTKWYEWNAHDKKGAFLTSELYDHRIDSKEIENVALLNKSSKVIKKLDKEIVRYFKTLTN